MDFKQWNRIDRAIFTTAFVLLLLFSYFLYDDSLLFKDNGNSNQETVGQILKAQNDVRQKTQDSFSWAPTSNKHNVRHMDSIFTGDNSEAQIKLKDGSVIRVKPNSLVTINMKQGQMQLDLKYGDLLGEIAKDSKIQIKINGEDVQLKSNAQSSVQIKKSKDGSVKLDTLKGKAVVESKKGINEVKEATPPKLTIKDLLVTRMNSKDKFDLGWQSEGDRTTFAVFVAKDGNFQEPVFSQKTDNLKTTVHNAIPSGDYQWKVVAYKEDGTVWAQTTAHQLRIETATAPQWIKPETDGPIVIRLRGKDSVPQAPIKLTWTEISGLESYEIETSQTADFASVLHTTKQVAGTWDTPALSSGKYYFRVRGLKGSNLTDWSATRNVDLDVSVFELPAPKLTEKRIEFVPPLASDRKPASEQSPRMSWSQVNGADAYTIQISRNESFSAPLEREVKVQDFNWEKYAGGKYFFRVRAKNKEGFQSEPSEVGQLLVKLGTPIIEPMKPLFVSSNDPNGQPSAQSVDVKWSEIATAFGYELEIDTDPNFPAPKKMLAREPASAVLIEKPGQYHLRVKALNEGGKAVTEYSPKEDLLYTFKRQLASPSIVAPIQNFSLYLQKLAVPFLRFEWKPVAEAHKYEFEMSDISDFSKLLFKTESTTSRLSVRKKLPVGPIYWRIRAVSSDVNFTSEWTEPREIKVERSSTNLFIE